MFNLSTTAYAEAAAAQGQASGGMFSIVWLVAMIVVFYFVLVRPQKKQEKKMKENILQ